MKNENTNVIKFSLVRRYAGIFSLYIMVHSKYIYEYINIEFECIFLITTKIA